jgi:hypothetical protein
MSNTKSIEAIELDTQVSNMIMGGLKEMLNNKEYCYISSNPRYSELKEPGERYVVSLIQSILPKLIESRNESLKDFAEKHMLDQLSR